MKTPQWVRAVLSKLIAVLESLAKVLAEEQPNKGWGKNGFHRACDECGAVAEPDGSCTTCGHRQEALEAPK